MKASELIQLLTAIKDKVGDYEVAILNDNTGNDYVVSINRIEIDENYVYERVSELTHKPLIVLL